MILHNPKIIPFSEIGIQCNLWRMKNEKIVFTNGCFDILHLGHVAYLQSAAQLGTKLVLGLNSDSSIQQLGKSKSRPLQNELSRSHVMAALECVSAVVIFNESTPLELIRLCNPHVLVKGADYSIENIVGASEVLANHGEVKTIEFIAGYSTTAIEKKIIDAYSNS